MPDLRYEVSPAIDDRALNRLYAAAWPNHRDGEFMETLRRWCLAWVCAFAGDELVGFIKVAWDGEQHAFLLDTTVHRDFQRRGIGTELVRLAVEVARERGLEWVHVDYDSHLDGFYTGCGFRHTPAGLIGLRDRKAGG